MDSKEPQIITLGELKTVQRMDIVNRTSSSQKYTFDCGEYGKISFNLIIGGTLSFTAGTIAPKITTNDPD